MRWVYILAVLHMHTTAYAHVLPMGFPRDDHAILWVHPIETAGQTAGQDTRQQSFHDDGGAPQKRNPRRSEDSRLQVRAVGCLLARCCMQIVMTHTPFGGDVLLSGVFPQEKGVVTACGER